MMQTREICVQVARLMQRVWDEAPENFSGLGLIVYSRLGELPYLPLDVPASDAKIANAVGEEVVAGVLAHLSTLHSPWHDGFHFIRLHDLRLTHVAQFVSPPVPAGEGAVRPERGARHMAAALASMVDGVVLTGVLPAQGEILLYQEGRRVRIKGVF